MKHRQNSNDWPRELHGANALDIGLWLAGLILMAGFMIGWSDYADSQIQVASAAPVCHMTNSTQGYCHE